MESPITERHVFDDLVSLSRAAAKETCRLLSNAISYRGEASIVLSGGTTPKTLYSILAKDFHDEVAWDHVDFFWGDERYVPHDQIASNYYAAQQIFLSPLNISQDRIHPIPTTFNHPADAADSYERDLQSHFRSQNPSFDVLLLGMGADGHVASLFPGSPALLEKERLVVVTHSPAPPSTRISLTFRAINNASSVMILIAGNEKKEILDWIQKSEHRRTYPVSLVTGRKRLL